MQIICKEFSKIFYVVPYIEKVLLTGLKPKGICVDKLYL